MMQRIPALVFTLVAVQLAACGADEVAPLVPPSERDDRAAEALGAHTKMLAKLDGSFRFPGLDAGDLGAPVTYVALDSLGDLGLVQFDVRSPSDKDGADGSAGVDRQAADAPGGLPGTFDGRPLQQEMLPGGIRVASTRTDWMRSIGARLTATTDSALGLPALAREVATAPSWLVLHDMTLLGRVAPRGIREIPQIGTIVGRFDAVAVGLTPHSDTLHVELTGEPVEGASATQIAGLLSAAALFAGMQSTLPVHIRDIIRSARVTTRRDRVVVSVAVVDQTAPPLP